MRGEVVQGIHTVEQMPDLHQGFSKNLKIRFPEIAGLILSTAVGWMLITYMGSRPRSEKRLAGKNAKRYPTARR